MPDLKQKIFPIAIELISRKGYFEVKMEDIAFSTGLPLETLLEIFESKEKLMQSMVDYYFPDDKKFFKYMNPAIYENDSEIMQHLLFRMNLKKIENQSYFTKSGERRCK